jgi:tetratricopeptide (TPR) repeat protein
MTRNQLHGVSACATSLRVGAVDTDYRPRLGPNLVQGCNPRILRGILFLALGWACALNGLAETTNDTFAAGLELSRAGEFAGAAAAFEKAAQTRPSVGAYINLGLSEWNRGHAGAAILAWEKARWIDPRDARAVGNLS